MLEQCSIIIQFDLYLIDFSTVCFSFTICYVNNEISKNRVIRISCEINYILIGTELFFFGLHYLIKFQYYPSFCIVHNYMTKLL